MPRCTMYRLLMRLPRWGANYEASRHGSWAFEHGVSRLCDHAGSTGVDTGDVWADCGGDSMTALLIASRLLGLLSASALLFCGALVAAVVVGLVAIAIVRWL